MVNTGQSVHSAGNTQIVRDLQVRCEQDSGTMGHVTLMEKQGSHQDRLSSDRLKGGWAWGIVGTRMPQRAAGFKAQKGES